MKRKKILPLLAGVLLAVSLFPAAAAMENGGPVAAGENTAVSSGNTKETAGAAERENIEETSANSEETQSYIVDISEENLETFEDREKVINEILSNVMSEEKRSVKIEYENKINNSYERFKIEIEPILNECGINVIF